jgi:predicted RNA-binding protein with PUA domain
MYLPLVKCYWCENCQSVIDSAKTCEGCGSSISIVALSIWMDRERRDNTLAIVTNSVRPFLYD